MRLAAEMTSALEDGKFAVIIDETHSSQSSSVADRMNQAISGGGDEEEPEDLQDKFLAAMEARKMAAKASFFAFAVHRCRADDRNLKLAEEGELHRRVPQSFSQPSMASMSCLARNRGRSSSSSGAMQESCAGYWLDAPVPVRHRAARHRGGADCGKYLQDHAWR